MHAGDFPVPGDAVLARGGGAHASPRCGGIVAPSHTVERLDVAETEPLQLRQHQTAALARQIAKCVAAVIAVIARIGSCTDPNAVENYDPSPFQMLTLRKPARRASVALSAARKVTSLRHRQRAPP